MSTSQDDHLIGRLALHYKLISQDQLAEATLQQSREGGRRKLGEILVESGVLPQRRFEQLLVAQQELLAKRQADAPAPLPSASATGPVSLSPMSPPPPPTPPVAVRVPSLSDNPPEGRRRIDLVLAYAVAQGASDIHIHSAAPLRIRQHGRMTDLDPQPIARDIAQRAIEEILSSTELAILAEHGQVDLAYTVPGVSRFRGNVYRQQRGWDAVFRAIPPRPPSLADLGMPSSLARFANFHQGLVLITGPAGCGKSSTLAAMLNIVNEDRRDHIITIEDPIEVLHPSKRCVVNQRQVGPHTESFARALRAALREDPDVIAIGELRDLETISLALTAAETGHLVLATLHTNNAIRTINRVLGVFPPSQQDQIRTMLSESLRAIVSQRLIPRADGTGRVPALEILVANKAVGNLVRDNKTFQIKSVLQTGGTQGMCLLDASLAELVKTGTITREEAARNAEDPARFTGAPPVSMPGAPGAPGAPVPAPA